MYLVISLLLNALALIATSYIVPGFTIANFWPTAIVAAIVLAIINTFIKPILILLTFPLTIVTLGLFLFVVNAIVLWMMSLFVPGVGIASFWSAIIAAIVLSIVSAVLSMLFGGNKR